MIIWDHAVGMDSVGSLHAGSVAGVGMQGETRHQVGVVCGAPGFLSDARGHELRRGRQHHSRVPELRRHDEPVQADFNRVYEHMLGFWK